MMGRNIAPPKNGFSLVELVIIMLVLSIFAAMAATQYSASLDYFRTNGAARMVAADLQYAARLAQRTSQPRQVQFDVPGNSYTLNGVADIDFAGEYYTVDFDDSEYSASITSADFNGGFLVTFDMYGKPDYAGSVVVQSGSATQTVTLNVDGTTTTP